MKKPDTRPWRPGEYTWLPVPIKQFKLQLNWLVASLQADEMICEIMEKVKHERSERRTGNQNKTKN